MKRQRLIAGLEFLLIIALAILLLGVTLVGYQSGSHKVTGLPTLETQESTGPAPAIQFVSPTPLDYSQQDKNSVYVNLSTSSSIDHYSLVDFDSSLVGWWRMDHANATTVFDESQYGNDGTLQGHASTNSTGRWGNPVGSMKLEDISV